MSKMTEWLAERRPQFDENNVYIPDTGYIGASQTAACLGISPWDTPHGLWLDKMGIETKTSTLAMRRGIRIEPFLSDEYKLMTGVRPRRSQLYRHPKFSFIACNPDREIVVGGKRGILQLKDVGYWPGKQFGIDGADQIPEHYLAQIQGELMVCERYGFEFVQLCACVDGRDLRVFTYTHNTDLFEHAHVFDREATKKIFNYELNWWHNHIVNRIEPQMTGMDPDTEWLQRERKNYPNGGVTNTDPETDRQCVKLQASLVREKRAKLVVAERKNKIRRFMATESAAVLESTVGEFTFKTDVNGKASFRVPFKSGDA